MRKLLESRVGEKVEGESRDKKWSEKMVEEESRDRKWSEKVVKEHGERVE